MQNWDAILRNSRSTGHFAGASQRDQDAYFAFFDGGDFRLVSRFSMFRSWLTRSVQVLPKNAKRQALRIWLSSSHSQERS